MQTCSQCGASVSDGVRYCTSCGVPLSGNATAGAGRAAEGEFTRLLLVGTLVFSAACGVLVGVLYLLPPEYLQIKDVQEVVQVAPEADFTVGTSRMVLWGDRSVLVIRRASDQYSALHGTDPYDDCFLRWDADAQHVTSPCTYVVYDLQGRVIGGLTTESLRRYRVFTRNGIVYVTERDANG